MSTKANHLLRRIDANTPTLYQFFCAACHAWLYEDGVVHEPAVEGDHKATDYRVSRDGGKTWTEE